ncbi:uncharacterized protein BDZ99DRAFT_122544 [Mytilinidion resinicola]|uniref:BTB domain-containing protein n=1 Tax=Mytilinidion resinicola TaxID=574789 RepID=A0A6A6Z4Y2_9PEZI|nr:uncharacterized protein BDZ99DRAFT_122544 [Mytilinidion resinicola]KAF2815799.1 hypothetical protein BDZ99DRAFT_122544 [Mytilinidion resinicola]
MVSGSDDQTMEEFTLHKGIAMHRSATIQQMCLMNPDAKEFKRPEWRASAFNMFMQWAYQGRFYIAFPEGPDHYDPLLKVYLLGKDLQATGLMTCTIQEMCRYSDKRRTLFSNAQIKQIYACSPPAGALRRLVVDQYVFNGDATQIDSNTEASVPKQFLGDLTRRALGKEKIKDDPCTRPENYIAKGLDLLEVQTNDANPQPRVASVNSSATTLSTLLAGSSRANPPSCTNDPRSLPSGGARPGAQDLPFSVGSDEESDA